MLLFALSVYFHIAWAQQGFMWLADPDLNGFLGDLPTPFAPGQEFSFTVKMQCPGSGSDVGSLTLFHFDVLRAPRQTWPLVEAFAISNGYTDPICGTTPSNTVAEGADPVIDPNCVGGTEIVLSGNFPPAPPADAERAPLPTELTHSSFGYQLVVESACYSGPLGGPPRPGVNRVPLSVPIQAERTTECRFWADPNDEARRFIVCDAFDTFYASGAPSGGVIATTPFFTTPEFEVIKVDVQLPPSRTPDCFEPFPDQTTSTFMLSNATRGPRGVDDQRVVCGNLRFPSREDTPPYRCEKPSGMPLSDDRSIFFMSFMPSKSCPCLLLRANVYPPANRDFPAPGDVHSVDVELLRVDSNREPNDESLLSELPTKWIQLGGIIEKPMKVMPGPNCPGYVDPCTAGTQGCPCRQQLPICDEGLACRQQNLKCIDPNGPTPVPPTAPTPAPPKACTVVQQRSCEALCGVGRVDRCDCSGNGDPTSHCKAPDPPPPAPAPFPLVGVVAGGVGSILCVTFMGLIGYAFYQQQQKALKGPDDLAKLYEAADKELEKAAVSPEPSSTPASSAAAGAPINSFGSAAPVKPSKSGKSAKGAKASNNGHGSMMGYPEAGLYASEAGGYGGEYGEYGGAESAYYGEQAYAEGGGTFQPGYAGYNNY